MDICGRCLGKSWVRIPPVRPCLLFVNSFELKHLPLIFTQLCSGHRRVICECVRQPEWTQNCVRISTQSCC
jgi:hypothetical protein